MKKMKKYMYIRMMQDCYYSINYGDKVSLSNNIKLGTVTAKAIAHNGISQGSVCVETETTLYWIKGKCCKHFLNENSWVFLEGEIEEFYK